jgi:hypothetical protein
MGRKEVIVAKTDSGHEIFKLILLIEKLHIVWQSNDRLTGQQVLYRRT